MLFLLFHLGTERYALEARYVVEVLPLLGLRTIPHAPRGVAGLVNCRGQPVPVMDLCELALGKASGELFSTRIILVNHPDSQGNERLLGLIAEKVIGVVRKQPGQFQDTGIRLDAAPYLGPLVMDEAGVIQCISPQHLLSGNVRNLVFSETLAAKREGY